MCVWGKWGAHDTGRLAHASQLVTGNQGPLISTIISERSGFNPVGAYSLLCHSLSFSTLTMCIVINYADFISDSPSDIYMICELKSGTLDHSISVTYSNRYSQYFLLARLVCV